MMYLLLNGQPETTELSDRLHTIHQYTTHQYTIHQYTTHQYTIHQYTILAVPLNMRTYCTIPQLSLD